MQAEDGTSNGDKWAVLGRRSDSEDRDYGGRNLGRNNVAGGEEDRGLKDESLKDGVVVEGEEVRGLKKESVDSRVTSKGGNGIAEGEEVRVLKREAINNGVTHEGGNGVANRKEVLGLKNGTVNTGLTVVGVNGVAEGEEKVQDLSNETVNNGMVLEVGNGVAESEEVLGSKKEVINNGVAIADGNVVAYSGEDLGSKDEAVNNEVAIADGSGVTPVEHDRLKNETVDHVEVLTNGFGVVEGKSGAVECFRTYKRRKHVKCASEFKVQENSRKHLEVETLKIDSNGQERSLDLDCLLYRLQSEANGQENAVHNGFCTEPDGHGATERCQRLFCDILASEEFSSLCKVLLENFQEMKPETIFDFSLINSRMKEQAYEQTPTLFLSDLQQVWQKLQNTGHQIVAIARSLSNLSKASFCERVVISTPRSFEDGKQVESISHMKPERRVECVTLKIGSCRHCGDKAEGVDCLVCDSCEEMYHLSCIEPAVEEIPPKSWFCANCTASGIGCQHENCVVCERLNVPKKLDDNDVKEIIPTKEEKLNELEENSICTCDGIPVSAGPRHLSVCKICKIVVQRGKIKICGHLFCPSKYYHVRCLSSKQLRTYGHCWYCPSCICQVCFTDKDDDKIVLCDGCDHAYHMYCLKPPLNLIPVGKWFCIKCDAGILAIRKARKAYESKKGKIGQKDLKPNEDIDKKWNRKRERESDKVGGMEMLITAANTLNSEEKMNAIQIESERTLK
ncbi:uncharacterized protein LOC124842239 [Vigna umbellata]|uniref:uncharacterized protein LOC124842239 n=1 Tax=Vigna umbellata TaxID=87088 RepID=UPI001F5EE58F|nr:uncharacterized protein LOC124842239 [Vigna umbellata]